jgi:hypothetical protein
MQASLLFLLLNSRILVTVSLLSYSPQVWQQIFLSPNRAGIFNSWHLNVISLCGVPIVSYYGVERPFLSLRARLSGSPNG